MERLARKDEEVYSWRPCTDDTLMINDKGRKSLGREAENSRRHFRGEQNSEMKLWPILKFSLMCDFQVPPEDYDSITDLVTTEEVHLIF